MWRISGLLSGGFGRVVDLIRGRARQYLSRTLNVRTTVRYRRHRYWVTIYLGRGRGEGRVLQRHLAVLNTPGQVRALHRRALNVQLPITRNTGITIPARDRGIRNARGSRRTV